MKPSKKKHLSDRAIVRRLRGKRIIAKAEKLSRRRQRNVKRMLRNTW